MYCFICICAQGSLSSKKSYFILPNNPRRWSSTDWSPSTRISGLCAAASCSAASSRQGFFSIGMFVLCRIRSRGPGRFAKSGARGHGAFWQRAGTSHPSRSHRVPHPRPHCSCSGRGSTGGNGGPAEVQRRCLRFNFWHSFYFREKFLLSKAVQFQPVSSPSFSDEF